MTSVVSFRYCGVSLEDYGSIWKVWTCGSEQFSVDGCDRRQRGRWVLAAFHSIVLPVLLSPVGSPHHTLFSQSSPWLARTHYGSFRMPPPSSYLTPPPPSPHLLPFSIAPVKSTSYLHFSHLADAFIQYFPAKLHREAVPTPQPVLPSSSAKKEIFFLSDCP